ncbi:hypothetical protein LTR36_000626 [Oleoguttula mirabilis]|uniref:Uncharacterized protein n=1 Tax=Oleoguttula mirabilis TaxID=1507867 RepID=A0AAV9JRR0_9PEZI|nr:hypothetical protein LTR36_000626 [Oleoguttula mirabilis]
MSMRSDPNQPDIAEREYSPERWQSKAVLSQDWRTGTAPLADSPSDRPDTPGGERASGKRWVDMTSTCYKWVGGTLGHEEPCPEGRAHEVFPVLVNRAHLLGHKTKTCKFWTQNQCWWPAENCAFAQERFGTDDTDENSQLMTQKELKERKKRIDELVERRPCRAELRFMCKSGGVLLARGYEEALHYARAMQR